MLYLLALLPGEDERLVRQVGEMAHNIMVRLIRVEIAEGLRVDIFRQVFHADNIPRVVIEVVINAIGPLSCTAGIWLTPGRASSVCAWAFTASGLTA
jgi:hypothetical protein